MAKTKITTVKAKNAITGRIKWFTEKTWQRLANMSRLHNGKTYPRQGWVRIAEQKAPAPDAAKEAAAKAAEQRAAKAAAEAKAAQDAADKQAAAKAAAAKAAQEANAPKAAESKKK